MKQINWGIIGCGDVTEVKSGPAFSMIENSSLVAVMRRNADKALDYALRHGVPKWYEDAEELIYDPAVSAIYVATPPDSHAEYAIRAMKAGKPVYVEKPMALNYRECEEMISVSRQCSVPLFVAYYRRSLPGFLKVKELIDNNEIGPVLSVNIQLIKEPSEEEKKGDLGWRINPGISGAGHFFDLGSHQLDYLDYLFGPIKSVTSEVKNVAGLYDAEDYVDAEFIFERGIQASGKWDFSGLGGENMDIIEIKGEKGQISFSTFDFVPVCLENQNGRKEFDFPKPDHVQYYLIEQVVKSLQALGESPSTGESAARTSKVMDMVVRSYYSK